ncbi:hypothetical protein COW36_04790 [bacterium (Candidatus Blackallbacteria) CG17_big_fil_post_rev_8_21_14_2_50_48_46]|uniref:Uncharacterized protein n=1 Tax=bacterium (Candidatus Blackallbacteria) CG17_big_fil_post_rev_8_21_14_2_50_48_46 TaxID=2014261 RepID=A0A2M7G917_9BACT|nr:MAG: hypothetical protein COW64_04155 [bacterium (Candidatus Blackallbacteria) CG18_big_fil_WC_8_21_14_2_50_49_26]PIW18612.1 MAG: hypothetical protein COW36_04790 [bacterium (Candidatus Blackallbacteria) CG17_big_fil_post_rev_8_21_14_2_50_48_46]PIW46402.1 MAG: hypothetical protein COW20_15890 [bacterium (Candidatus Blackallbacteria) CG13_big_fil_rev_8_21_14_2_50_49_14]
MKPSLSTWEQANIQRAKGILRRLWEASGIQQKALLKALEERGIPLKKTTLSMWLTVNGNFIRPKQEALQPLVEMFTPDLQAEQRQEILDELEALLGYGSTVLETSEMLRNRLSIQLDESMRKTLDTQEAHLRDHVDHLEAILTEIEPRLFEYHKGAPVVRVQAEEKHLIKDLLGIDSLQQARQYKIKGGDYEIPLTRVQSLDTVTRLVNSMNEGIRVLRAYIERKLLQEGALELDTYPRVEDFVSYAWEIADRLLYHNRLCRSVPALRRTLLRMMATCWGVRYLMQGQEGPVSSVEFQNILQLKGLSNPAEVACPVAVFMGLLARQMLKLYRGQTVHKGLNLALQAREMLQTHLPALPTEQEVFYYKKELANLCYDTASLLLWHRERIPSLDASFQSLMQDAFRAYTEVLSTVNLFHAGLSEQRANHLRCFNLISLCWTQPDLMFCMCEINKLSPGMQLNESYWTLQLARAVACSVLAYRADQKTQSETFKEAASRFVLQAALVPGLEQALRTELREDFILHKTLGPNFLGGSPTLSEVIGF